ncbi:cell envelope integrity protein TolA [Microbulbifer thermotolerans]|uniref:Protein TolA n=1 Tax=Microbulbifer thermotolerans TaxID=252514 RepID=A0A143HJ56_MICTH|nr:cell envelope integrity protein TolA [Microbulbifer thermotolerans]AMX01754.1 protein TolA [Microbulbifer thermotolerans]MCX2779528.1 cell envelope integrity protein TolA [Microbulbifer thermotolerans]MCX2783364.1 cell envelope integrity protein TolA [Microbulbifer thermotolerans]MCX2793400.1 cell envelope integrity protein TolA [Microbulbifer thermotolerans]MCX2801341.1 cell envelope integrity protein TolA [Microbulbifer thermotolerans]
MNNASSYFLPVVISLLFHGLLIAVLSFGWEAREPERKPMPQFVQAKLISAEALTPKKAAPPKVDLREQRRQRELERQRKAEAEKKRRAALERKKKEEAERKKKAEEAQREKERKERERKEKERREQLERERQSAFEEALEEEEELLEAREDTQAVMSVAQAIQQRIESVLSWPPSARNGMVTEVKINFVPTGRVVAANIVKSSGNAALDRAVLTAVRKVEVFPEVAEVAREEPALFERQIRTTQLIFRVEGLRQ